LNYSSHNRLIAGNFDRATNLYLHPNPTDFAHEIRIGWRRLIPKDLRKLLTSVYCHVFLWTMLHVL